MNSGRRERKWVAGSGGGEGRGLRASSPMLNLGIDLDVEVSYNATRLKSKFGVPTAKNRKIGVKIGLNENQLFARKTMEGTLLDTLTLDIHRNKNRRNRFGIVGLTSLGATSTISHGMTVKGTPPEASLAGPVATRTNIC